MKVGVSLFVSELTAKPQDVFRKAEALGFDALIVPEHAFIPVKHKTPYPAGGGEIPDWYSLMPDPFVLLGIAAGVTKTIKLMTGICLVPEHNPLVLAKVTATLDYLSGGRFALGVGIGWLEEEFVAMGIPWEHRAKRTREYIEAMRKLWGEDPCSYSGEYVNFKNVRSNPKPVQGGKLPVIFGGESAPALRRVAEYGNGWCGFNLTPDEAAAKIRKLEELLKANGRKRSDIEIAVSPYSKPISKDDLKRYRDAGADEVVLITLRPPRAEGENLADLEKIAREWVEPAAAI